MSSINVFDDPFNSAWGFSLESVHTTWRNTSKDISWENNFLSFRLNKSSFLSFKVINIFLPPYFRLQLIFDLYTLKLKFVNLQIFHLKLIYTYNDIETFVSSPGKCKDKNYRSLPRKKEATDILLHDFNRLTNEWWSI